MNQALLNSLTNAERRFIAETSSDALGGLDEEQVLALHGRARRMRDKYVKNYRRAAGSAVARRGARGLSYEENQRDRGKAEVFETALARVSRRLGTLASQSAAELRKERIAGARSGSSGPAARSAAKTAARTAVRTGAGLSRSHAAPRGAKKTTGGLKKDASSRSMGARRQAKRDAR